MSLTTYIKKRNFKKTPEPKGEGKPSSKALSFVVQLHDASHLHYDFRLELDGVLKSWAVPKGPSLNPKEKRLAVQVEDHPLSYGKFEGTIPKGNYGAGTVEIWDKGTYTPDPVVASDSSAILRKGLRSGSLKFTLHGKKLNGSFALVRLKDGKEKNWLLIKHNDEYASSGKTKQSDKSAKELDQLETKMKTITNEKPARKNSVQKNASKSPAVTTNSKQTKTKTAKALDKTISVNGHELKLTNLQKVFWPDLGYTKADVIEYYNTISTYILPHLKDRPQSLKRNPNGIADKGFFHKDAGEAAPDWVEHVKIRSESTQKDVNYILCNDKATLLYLSNLGCIELNPWNSRTQNLDHPDYLILDLDPSDGNTFKEVIDVALTVKEILDKAGATSYCKTSGATGIHIYVPLHAAYTYEQARHFAELVATLAADQISEIATVERSLEKRKKKNLCRLSSKQPRSNVVFCLQRPARAPCDSIHPPAVEGSKTQS